MAFYHKSRVTALSLRHGPVVEHQSSFHGLPPRKRFKFLHADLDLNLDLNLDLELQPQLHHHHHHCRLPLPLDKKRVLAPFFPPLASASFESSFDHDESEEETRPVKRGVPIPSLEKPSAVLFFENPLDHGKSEELCPVERGVPAVSLEKLSVVVVPENPFDRGGSEEACLAKRGVPVVNLEKLSAVVDFENPLNCIKSEEACPVGCGIPVVDLEGSSADAGRGIDDDEDDGIICDVCQGTDADPSDPIVLCDGCDVGVHATCYGSPLVEGIPDGEWKCRRCAGSREREKCCLCPSRDGAMKMTTNGEWAHVSCALFVAEVFFQHAGEREGVECGNVPRWRFEVACCVCGGDEGACLQCTEAGCGATFHVSCAIQRDLVLEYRAAPTTASSSQHGRRRQQRDIVISFCPLHTPSWNSEHRHCKIVPRDS